MANKNNTPRNKIFTLKKFILLIILLSIIVEWCFAHFNIDRGNLSNVLSLLMKGSPIFIFEPFVQKAIEEKNTKKTSNTKSHVPPLRVEDTNRIYTAFQRIIDHTGEFLKDVIPTLINNKFFCTVFVIYILVSIPTVWAKYQITGRVMDVVFEMQYSNTIENKSTETSASTELEPSIDSPPHNSIDTNELLSDKVYDVCFLIDPERYFTLPENDYNRLYFLSEPYLIADWSDINNISNTLNQFFIDLRSKQIPNSFDVNAPSSLRTEIADASELEKKLSNSDDLDKIIDTRLEAWAQYPKYSLAKLLAANYQRYALEYQKIAGNYYTIEYYYGNSIFWLFDCLTFADVNDDRIKSILASIRMRYHDIAMIAPEGSTEQLRAYILSESFKILENNYSEYN